MEAIAAGIARDARAGAEAGAGAELDTFLRLSETGHRFNVDLRFA